MIKLSQPRISEEVIQRVSEVLRSGNLVHGQECIDFEQELADFIGVKQALVVSSGTAALHVTLLSLGIGAGDAVLVPDFTFPATANVVEITGAKAVMVDVDPYTYNMDPKLLKETISNWRYSEKLKAIMPVLEFGNPANISEYKKIAKEHGLFLIEDAACAIGAKWDGQHIGTFGEIGCFSFHPRKTLTTGEGGLITTNDDALAKKASLLRNHGMFRTKGAVSFETIGLNYRLTNFQAAIGRGSLRDLSDWLNVRRNLAALYYSLLSKGTFVEKIQLPNFSDGHSWQSFMIVLDDKQKRHDVISHLKENGIETNLGAQSMSQLGLYDHVENRKNTFSVSAKLYKSGLVLPLHENMSEDDVKKVVFFLGLAIGAQC